jgi:predicted RNase H-like HicB family nuclease
MTSTYPIIIEKSEAGFYAECPSVQGVYAQGKTEVEVLENLKEVLTMTLLDIKENSIANRLSHLQVADTKFPILTFSAMTVTV